MSNILQAVISLIENPIVEVKEYYSGLNRANSVGEALENYVKDLIAGTLEEKNDVDRLRKIEKVFSYEGNQSNPPDLMISGGDAIETKKVESENSALALNSSYPKAKIYSSDPMITKDCRECEEWDSKDIVYFVGHSKDNKLKCLWIIYGDCFAADKEVYEKIKKTISEGVEKIEGVEFTPTNELGKIKYVDPLKITDLRIRGMWHIKNPNQIFPYLEDLKGESEFKLNVIMKKDKYLSFPQEERSTLEKLKKKGLIFKDINIKNPNNPVKLLDAVLINYKLN